MTLPPERAGHEPPPWLAEVRAGSAAALARRSWQVRRQLDEAWLGGVRVLRVAPGEGAVRARVLHFHGGGFRMGQPEMDAPFAEALTDACHVEVWIPAYRLAPEHPFPAGLNDALAALMALPRDLPVIVSGASAGGGIAAGLALLARDKAIELAGLVLLSPWLDLRADAGSYAGNASSDLMFSQEGARIAAGLYLQGGDPAHPLASPLLGDLAGLPPCLLSYSTSEVLADDARRFHRRLDEAGVPCTVSAIAGMEHVAVCRTPDALGAAETLACIIAFLKEIAPGQ